MSPSRPRQGLTARSYAAVVVGLRHVIPLAWIAAAVAATVALPGLGDAPAAPLDDLAAKGGSAANAQQLATRTFGFPLATDTAVVQRDPAASPEDAQRRQVDAALAVRDRRDPALTHLRAALPISNAKVRTPSGERGTTAITYLFFAARREPRRRDAPSPQRYARQTSAAARARSSASPARRRRATRSSTRSSRRCRSSRRPASSLIAADRRPRLPLDRRSLVALSAAGIAYTIAMRVLPWLGERAERHGAQGDRAGGRRAPARAGHRLLDLLPVRDAPPAARGRRAPPGGARGGRPGRRRSSSPPASSSPPGPPRSSSATCSSSAPSGLGSRRPRSSPSPSRSRSSPRSWRCSAPRLFGARQLREEPSRRRPHGDRARQPRWSQRPARRCA